MASSEYSHLYNCQRWRKKRLALLKASPLCVMCQRLGRTSVATVADHVEPHKGDLSKFWFGRLQALCAPCHNGAKKVLETTGKVRGCDANGYPMQGSEPESNVKRVQFRD